MSPDELEPLSDLLGRNGVDASTEEPFPNDGWSRATMTRLWSRDGGRRFILKRDSLERDWIARATADRPLLREAWFAVHGPELPWPIRAPYLGAGRDGSTGELGILMPDLSDVLFDWNATLTMDQLDRVMDAMAILHMRDWQGALDRGSGRWTPWRERLTLICRPSLERTGSAHEAVADRILRGWDAWDRAATPAARAIVADLAVDPQPLLDALLAEPSTLLHGDLKLANAGIAPDGAIDIVDWQMVMVAPVAIELGWFLVSNVNALPLPVDAVIDRYRSFGVLREQGLDAAILVGLLLRGWRKGYDTEAGLTLASGVTAADDLAWWCDRAVEAAGRIL